MGLRQIARIRPVNVALESRLETELSEQAKVRQFGAIGASPGGKRIIGHPIYVKHQTLAALATVDGKNEVGALRADLIGGALACSLGLPTASPGANLNRPLGWEHSMLEPLKSDGVPH
jgi:hypothetical protein